MCTSGFRFNFLLIRAIRTSECDLDIRQAYLGFSKLTSGIRCGHTYANFYNQPAHIQQLAFEQPDKLPFCFRLLNRRMILTDNLSEDDRLVTGTEIKAINGIPVGIILDSLLTVVKADGDNDGKRLKDLEIIGLGPFESFDIYFPLFFPAPKQCLQIGSTAPELRPALAVYGKGRLQIGAQRHSQQAAWKKRSTNR